MHRRKLICVDMDGTMLRDDQTISNETQQYFRDLVKQGYYIVITSGRPFRAIEKYYNQLLNNYDNNIELRYDLPS